MAARRLAFAASVKQTDAFSRAEGLLREVKKSELIGQASASLADNFSHDSAGIWRWSWDRVTPWGIGMCTITISSGERWSCFAFLPSEQSNET